MKNCRRHPGHVGGDSRRLRVLVRPGRWVSFGQGPPAKAAAAILELMTEE